MTKSTKNHLQQVFFNVQSSKMNYKNETRRCFNCGIQGHLKATCRKKPMQNYNGHKGNFWNKSNNGKSNSPRQQYDTGYRKSSYSRNQQSSSRINDQDNQNSIDKGNPVSYVNTNIDNDQEKTLNYEGLHNEEPQDLLL